MRTILISLFLIFFKFFFAEAQQENYLQYYDLINRAEELFTQGSYKQCFLNYDQAFKCVKSPFLKDYFIAAECAVFAGDSIKSLSYLEKAFVHGFPWDCLFSAQMFHKINSNSSYLEKARSLFNTTHKSPKIDYALRDSIYMRSYFKEQLKRKKILYNDKDLKEFQKAALNNIDYFISFLQKGSSHQNR